MTMNSVLRDEMVAAIPQLRKFAVALSGAQQADDLVQETLLQACSKIHLFDSNSHMRPWLMTILRNRFYDDCRKRQREVEDVDGNYAETLATGPSQIAHAEHQDLRMALLKLPDEMRDVLLAVGWRGLSYQEAAQACDVPVGTIRSRVHRARACLAALLDIERPLAHSFEYAGIHGLGFRGL